MTAVEIRQYPAQVMAVIESKAEDGPSMAQATHLVAQTTLLAEIAAQLAELNQNLSVFGNITATYHGQFPVAGTR